MRLHRLTHCGTPAFPDEITIDFDALPTIVGISGDNGAGKTTLLDVIAAPWLGEFAYRPGSLAHWFAGPGSIIEEWSVHDQRYRSHLRVDPVSGRTEGMLYAGETMIAGPLISEYRRVVQQIVGPPEWLLAACYSSQDGMGAFLTASRAERKAILVNLLGLQRFKIYEAAAKGKVRSTEQALAGLRARVAELETQAEKLPEMRFRLGNLEAEHLDAQLKWIGAEGALDTAQAVLSEARATLAALDPTAAELLQVEQELSTLAGQVGDATGRRTRNREVLGREEEITAAVARVAEIGTALAGLDAEMSVEMELQRARQATAQAAVRLRTTAQHAVTTATRDQERLQRQAGLLTTVPCGGEGQYAGCALLKDARAAHDSLPALEATLTAAKATLAETQEPAALVDLTAPLVVKKRALDTERTALAPLVADAGPLSAARARVEELDGQLTELGARQAAATARKDALSVRLAERPACQRAVTTAEGAVTQAQRRRLDAQAALSQVEREVGQVEGQLVNVRAAATTLAAVRAELDPTSQALARWTLLQRALGPAGIPALLIDQALPTLSQYATTFARECTGNASAAISLRSQREATDADTLLETLDVLATLDGSALRDYKTFSEGERVMISEPVSLSLAVYHAGAGGRRIDTLLRDEVTAPLDLTRAPAYVATLRKAAALGGFRQILFISHNARALELADARLEIAAGRVTVS